MKITMIAAVSKNGAIGYKGKIPWRLSGDMKHFSQTTKGHHILMGRVTFESIPPDRRPLPNRVNMIITRQLTYTYKDVEVYLRVTDAINAAEARGESELFIAGGQDIYELCMPHATNLIITEVHEQFHGDKFFPGINLDIWQPHQSESYSKDDKNDYDYTIVWYRRITE